MLYVLCPLNSEGSQRGDGAQVLAAEVVAGAGLPLQRLRLRHGGLGRRGLGHAGDAPRTRRGARGVLRFFFFFFFPRGFPAILVGRGFKAKANSH